MSLCYDFSKWTMITLVMVAISLTVGLLFINFAHGWNSTKQLENSTIKSETIKQFYDRLDILKQVLNNCYQHASDSPNPVQDLVDKGFLSQEFNGQTCKDIILKHNEMQNMLLTDDLFSNNGSIGLK